RCFASHRHEPEVPQRPQPLTLSRESRTPATRPELHAGREGVSLALWHPLAFTVSPGASLHPADDGKRISGWLRTGRVAHRHVWRKLKLERSGMVPGEFFDHRVSAKISLLFWR